MTTIIKRISIIVLIFVSNVLVAQNVTPEVTTTYYLIRHAEKDRSDKTNKNPHLITTGKLRAKRWAIYFKDKALDAIYSTNYNRTKETATPTANANNLKIQYYTPSTMYNEAFKQDTKGKTVLIVGHSNTTPNFVNLILEEDRFKNMPDTDNSSLYIVTIKKHETAEVTVKTVE